MAKLSIRDLEPEGKKVLMRVDFNVPLDGEGRITDDTRIRAAVPTIEYLVKAGARIILVSHLGRPKGERAAKYSLAPAAERLGELVEAKVTFIDDCVGNSVEAAAESLANGEILVLENVRYYAEEEENDEVFAKKLAALADIYVNDAFGTAHRAHASTEGVTRKIGQAAQGFLMERELEYLEGKLENPERPFLVVMGGAKVSDKIDVLSALMGKADAFLIGGAMAYTFLLAQGKKVGKSLVEADKVDLALKILADAEARGTQFLLPADTRYAAEFADDAPTACTRRWDAGGAVPDDQEGIDIGDEAIREFSEEIAKAKTILWNGPMGVFEKRGFDIGTRAIAKAIAESSALKIVGGGDSVTAVNKFGFAAQMDHISTGGGASLELLEGKVLPGVAALTEK